MIKLNRETYRDKMFACWLGKNIGGTMGGPYEGVRELLDIKGFSTPKNTTLPNDDLDLQIVWLAALERLGPYDLTAQKLGEFWQSYVTPHWNEYGICKTNMSVGLVPPLAGDYRNEEWKNSNGAWIRTELWACLAPACPDVAVKYAYEDGCVDHGAGEGTTAAIFVAAMESAAFVETDIRKLVDIGLSKIPEDSRTARSIRLLLECFDSGMSWSDARNAILKENEDIGDGWFEAPSNVAYAVLGLLYGDGDFKKSMITAINCGDDTDCTAATLGSLLGIMGGSRVIPEDWREHMGDADEIVSISIALGVLYNTPKTCTELTERIMKQCPIVLAANNADVIIHDGADEIPENVTDGFYSGEFARSLCTRPVNSFTVDFNYANVTVCFDGDPEIAPNGQKKIKLHFENNCDVYGGITYNMSLRWILPEGWTIDGKNTLMLPHITIRNPHPSLDAEYTITANENVASINRLILEIVTAGRPTVGLVPIVIMG